jgi:dolichyl-phosphate-mannose-protein mannosyltransferase
MAPKGGARSYLGEKTPSRLGRSPSRSPAPARRKAVAGKHADYTSEGVTDNDVFLLPGSDYRLMGLITFIAAVVRLFRIYQPSSVVFDEVQ